MNEPSNTPMYDSAPPAPEPFYQTWIKALTKPNEQTYVEIANSPDANPNKAYLWMFLVSLVSGLISAVISLIVSSMQYGSEIGAGIGTVICIVPIAGAIGVGLFAIGVAIVQWVASRFGGTGSYNKLVYVVAAYGAPIGLVSGLLASFNSIPYVAICSGILVLGLSLYSLYLEILSVKAVNGLDWGKSAASVLIPFFVILFVCGCLVIGGLMLLAPVIGNVFSTINSSLGY